MTLKEHIDDIRNNLEKRQFMNEAAVSQGIILRLLNVLAWPTFNTQVVIPEYGVEGTRVDFALCHPLSKPIVFVEVKQVGNIDGAEKQLFQYAFHAGVPIAILTDGQKWRFFHPMGEGDYKERQVCELDLTKGNSEENAKHLNRYLNYESMLTGEAIRAIKEDYQDLSKQKEIERRLPEAWNKLLQDADEFLLDVVAEKVENLCRYRPTDEQVLDFLKGLERKTEGTVKRSLSQSNLSMQPLPIRSKTPQALGQPRRTGSRRTRLRVTMPDGKVIEHHNATDTWLETILTLGTDRVIKADKKAHIISLSPNFRGDRPEQQHGQYYISMDYSTKDKKRLLDRIAERLGVRLEVEIVDKS